MTKGADILQKRIEERKQQRQILEAILVSAIDEKNPIVPTIKEFILSEVVNGTVDYLHGAHGPRDTADKIVYAKNHSTYEYGKFEGDIFSYLTRHISFNYTKLTPPVTKALLALCEDKWSNPDGPDKPYPDPKIYSAFKDLISFMFESTTRFPKKNIDHVNNDILPKLPEQVANDIKGIGREMRKYISEDLKYIKNNYHW